MTINNKPSTGLPWRVSIDRDGYCEVRSKFQLPVFDIGGEVCGEDAQDVEYAVHACNAYPKLVEELKDASSFLKDLGFTFVTEEISHAGRSCEGAIRA